MKHNKLSTEQFNRMTGVLSEVREERERQQAKWGEQNHLDGTGGSERIIQAAILREACNSAANKGSITWRHIAEEEDAEAYAESDPKKLRAELLQRAAVAVAWIEAIDRRTK